MIAARRRHLIDGSLPTGTAYAEQVQRQDGWLDSALLTAWGRVSAHLMSRFERARLDRLVQRIEDEEKSVAALTDAALLKAADDLRSRLAVAGTQPAELARAFALAREATRRHVGLRHFPVQLIGGAAMMGGALAEMEAGEGKTITALLPAVTAALMGRPVHVVTVRTISRAATPSSCVQSMRLSDCPPDSSKTGRSRESGNKHTRAILPTAPTKNWFLIICATALPWAYAGHERDSWSTNFSRRTLPDSHRGYSCAGCISPSSMRPIVF